MRFYILTLFPEMVRQGLHTSILGRAEEADLIRIHTVNIRDYTKDKHKKVDDYPYGGGAGMLMQAQPVYDAFQAVKEQIRSRKREEAGADGQQNREKPLKVIYLTPQGQTFSQKVAEELAQEEDLVFLCGHYEGIDERVLQEIVTDEVSIGDYVLTGGELPAMVMIDTIARLVPGVLNNEESAHTESFHNHLLEYPQYSRPEVWQGREVPKVLLSGDHKKIEQWRQEQSEKRTLEKRPDLYAHYQADLQAIQALMKNKLIHMDMIEALRLGNAELLCHTEEGIVIWEKNSRACMIAAVGEEQGKRLFQGMDENIKKKAEAFIFHGNALPLHEAVCEELGIHAECLCYQAVYTRGVRMPVSDQVQIRPLAEKDLSLVTKHYTFVLDEEYIRERLKKGVIWGAYLQDTPVGFVGEHEEGSIGMLEVFPEYRHRGIALALEADAINRKLSEGRIPYGQIVDTNEASIHLQEKLDLRISKDRLGWYFWKK